MIFVSFIWSSFAASRSPSSSFTICTFQPFVVHLFILSSAAVRDLASVLSLFFSSAFITAVSHSLIRIHHTPQSFEFLAPSSSLIHQPSDQIELNLAVSCQATNSQSSFCCRRQPSLCDCTLLVQDTSSSATCKILAAPTLFLIFSSFS